VSKFVKWVTGAVLLWVGGGGFRVGRKWRVVAVEAMVLRGEVVVGAWGKGATARRTPSVMKSSWMYPVFLTVRGTIEILKSFRYWRSPRSLWMMRVTSEWCAMSPPFVNFRLRWSRSGTVQTT